MTSGMRSCHGIFFFLLLAGLTCYAQHSLADDACPFGEVSGCQVEAKLRFGVLWYPVYPDGSPSCAHTKVVVNGVVYGTMGKYDKMHDFAVHARLAKRSRKDSFFFYELEVSDAELKRVQAIVDSGNAKALLLPMCVQGTCKAVNWGTSFKIPPPFNQVPTLAAMYLATAHYAGFSKVKSIEFHGKSKLSSLLSTDVAIDGAIALGGGAFIYMVIRDSVLHAFYDDGKDKKKGKSSKEEQE